MGLFSPSTFVHLQTETIMKAHLKNALMTTVMVLATIYVARQFSMTSKLVDKAITG
jgi:hypothetical protein